MEGLDELEEKQTQQQSPEPGIHCRLRQDEVTFYQRMAEYWRQIISGLEEENYNAYVSAASNEKYGVRIPLEL